MLEDLQAAVQSEQKRARVTLALLALGMAMSAVGIFSGIAQHSLLASMRDGIEVTEQQAGANDARQQIVGIIQIVVFLATAVTWLVWQFRAYANLRLIGSRDTDVTPGWSVGYWFIPLVNLVRVYQITNELWRRSELKNIRDPIGGLSATPLVAAWWIVYLIDGGLGRIALGMGRRAQTAQDLIGATDMSIFVDVIAIVSAILAFVVVKGIDRFQREFSAAPVPH